MTRIVHVAGEPIRVANRTRQRCSWCGDAIIDGDRYRPLTLRELARGMSFPDTYSWPEGLARNVVTLGLGNAICPLVGRAAVAAVREAA